MKLKAYNFYQLRNGSIVQLEELAFAGEKVFKAINCPMGYLYGSTGKESDCFILGRVDSPHPFDIVSQHQDGDKI